MGFERCHPAVNFIYFVAVIAGMTLFRHPVFLAVSFLCAFIYSVKRNGWKAVIFNLTLLALVFAYALYYSSHKHFGITVLQQNFIGNNITLEALVYGFVIGLIVAGVMIWFSCVYSVFTTDKVVYLFGKISPRGSIFLAIMLRMVPRIKLQARKINTAQCGIGRGVNQGNLWQRWQNTIRIISMLITWTVESLANTSDSMQNRGSTLRGRKVYSIYRFDNRDRAYVVALFMCLTVMLMGILLKQTNIIYDPRIMINPITPMSFIFYAGYGVFCCMPLMLELWTEYRFQKARNVI